MKRLVIASALSLVVGVLVIAAGCDRPCTTCGGAQSITPLEAYDMIQTHLGDPDFVIIDVRTPAEYSAEHIEDAINIDFYSSTFEDDLDALDKDKIYLVYCGSGNRSGQALTIMNDLGFQEAYDIEGGITAWKDAGLPTV